jgi:hypothetical protein
LNAPPVEDNYCNGKSKVDEATPTGEEVKESATVSDVTQTSLYESVRSRPMGQGDYIRGDLRILPDNSHHSQWFHVNAKSDRDLRKGIFQLNGIDKEFLNTPLYKIQV